MPDATDHAESAHDPVALLFGGMEKLGPGSNADTLHVLRLLPRRRFRPVVDAGCGTGRQTLALAKELRTMIHAVESYEPFVRDLSRRVRDAGIPDLVETHCMDMRDIPTIFRDVDLLWSEAAAYSIGFANALAAWRSILTEDGFVVVSELSWLTDQRPDAAREFFGSCYPAMRSMKDNIAGATSARYRVLATHTVPPSAWVEGYYGVLAPRAKALLDHPDASVRNFAAETVKEIEVFERSQGSYGYVFYVLQAS